MLLHHQFVKVAKQESKKIAIIDKTTNKSVTYGKGLIGSLILAKKIGRYQDEFIGVMMPTSAGGALLTIATLMADKIPVMINYSTGAETNILYAQQKCQFKTVITSKVLVDKIGCNVVEGMVFIEDIMKEITIMDKLSSALKSSLPLFLLQRLIANQSEDDTSVILFTSGSEKDPKAVQLTHKNIFSNVRNFGDYIKISRDDKLLANLVFFHVFGLTVNLWAPLCYGMTMVTYANPLDFSTICKIAREERPTIMVGTPSFFWGYLQKSEPGDFSSFRIMVSGADKCPDSLREGYLKMHGVTLLEGYGATETSPVISVNTPEFNRPGSTGRVIPGVMVKIISFETGEECSIGEVGKVMVKGDSVMKGYYRDNELTEEAMEDGWYNTGDMGYLDADGYLWHSGRFKRFVKIGGEMVSLVKVENTLEKYLPTGVSCCVVDISDDTKGSAIVATVNIEVNKADILKKLGQELPNIALPKHFVVIKELPMMSSGKIDFRTVSKIVKDML